jgi:aspartyl-tRNA(Asn)/glutamyl-tRNA(Gln) amidotransferase subunit A
LEDEVKDNIINSVKKFEQFNWDVEEAEIKIRNPESAFKTIETVGIAYDLQKVYNNSPEFFEPDLIAQVKLGLDNTSMSIGKAMDLRNQVYDTVFQYFKSYDLLITPTLPCTAIKPNWSDTGIIFPKIGKKSLSVMTWMTFTYPFNLTGLPAASIPSGWDSQGLPIGMQIVGRRFDEKTVLQVSKAFEEISPWQEKKPKFN